MKIEKEAIDRFWKYVIKIPFHPCWEWTGAKQKFGYGHLSIKRRNIKSHRISYIIHKGIIPEGLCVCHSCDNPGCVNPSHLFIGTQKDNAIDMTKKGRNTVVFGEPNKNSKLTDVIVKQIREEYRAGGTSWLKLSKKYKVSKSVIGEVIRRKSWKHV